MNVGELIAKLDKFDDNKEVVIDTTDGTSLDDVELEDGTVWLVGS